MAIKDRDALKGTGAGGLTNPTTGQVDTRPNYSILPSQTAAIIRDVIDSAIFGGDLSGVDVTATHDPTTNAITLALSAAVSRRLLGDGAISDGDYFASNVIPEGALAPDVRAGLFEGIRAVLNQNGDLVITIEGGGGHEEQTDPLTLPTSQGDEGDAGWSPRFSVREDGERRVLYLEGYVGGEGSAPALGANRYVGASGYVATATEATDVRGATGAKGDTGDVGGVGAAGQAVARYRLTTSASAPSAPTSLSDAAWESTRQTPTQSSPYEWAAVGVANGGETTFSWIVWEIRRHSSVQPSGGDTPTPTQDHAIYVTYGSSQSQTVFAASDFTDAARAVNNSADETQNTVTTRALASGQFRHYAIAIPATKRLVSVYIGTNPIDQRGAFNPQRVSGDDASAPPTVTLGATSHKYYAGTRPNNNSGETYRIVTEDA